MNCMKCINTKLPGVINGCSKKNKTIEKKNLLKMATWIGTVCMLYVDSTESDDINELQTRMKRILGRVIIESIFEN